jgi:hypothetical protein
LIGGEREVGWQLREAASRQPTRFLSLLTTEWAHIAGTFCDAIMDGVSCFLAYRHGNLRSDTNWVPIETPDAATLAHQILDELERHPSHWHQNHDASRALQACAHVVQNTKDAERLVHIAIGFSPMQEKSAISEDSAGMLNTGINMAKGRVVQALMTLANRLHENSISWPELLQPALRLFAADEHPGIRALILRDLPYLQSLRSKLGWEMFDRAMRNDAVGLWAIAEPCLYYAYHQKFEIVAPLLARIYREGHGKDLETWGRISALAALTKQVDFSHFLVELAALNTTDAWLGAATVWTHPDNLQQHREQCVAGLEQGLRAENPYADAVANQMVNLFREKSPLVSIPTELIRRCFSLRQNKAGATQSDIYGFETWLNATSHRDADQALEATEIYLEYVRLVRPHLYDYDNNLTQLLTRLFAQAEEHEESDKGAMLRRVVAVQDALLALGINGVNEWLRAAERP